MNSVAVYCGSATGNSEANGEAAHQPHVAAAINQVQTAVCQLLPQLPGCLEVVETMAERKTRMENLADAYICLPVPQVPSRGRAVAW